MKIEARITSIVNRGKLKANATVLIDDCFLVKDIKVIDGINGRFAAMPSKKTPRGDYDDICFPITKEARIAIEGEVLSAYSKKLDEIQNETT